MNMLRVPRVGGSWNTLANENYVSRVTACKKFSKHHLSIERSCPDFENEQHVWLKCNVFLCKGLRINLSDVDFSSY